MELEIKYTLKDYIQANRLHLKSSNRIYYLIAIGFVFLLFSIFFIILDPHGIFPWLILIYSVSMLTYPITIIPISAKLYMKKQKIFDEPVNLKFDGGFIYSKSKIGESKIKSPHKIVIGKELLLIYTTPKAFIIIPEKYCNNNQFSDIIEYVKGMPEGGEIIDTRMPKSKYLFFSFLIAMMNFIIIIFTFSGLRDYGPEASPVLKLSIFLWGFTILSSLIGIYLGIKSIIKKEKIISAILSILLNFIFGFLIVLVLIK